MFHIIIIIRHYNPLWGFAFSTKSLQVLLSLAFSFQFLTFSFFRSSITSSCHRCLDLPTGLIPMGFQTNSFLISSAWSNLGICPSHLILRALMNLTIPASPISLSVSVFFCVLLIYCLYCQDQISSLVFAFQKFLSYFHPLLLKSQ